VTRERLDRLLEYGILGLVCSILIYGPLALGGVLTQHFLILQLLTCGIAGLWLVRLWLSPGLRLRLPPLTWIVVIFALYAVWRYREADIEYVARQELIRVVLYAVLFLAVLNNLNRPESIQVVSITLFTLAAGLAVFAIYQFATHYDKVWHFVKPQGYIKRGSGTYMNPNHLAGLLEMVLPLSLGWALMSRLGHATRIVIGYSSLLMLVGIAVSGSRGGWISTGAALFVFFSILLFQKRFRIAAAAVLVLLLTTAVFFFVHFGKATIRLDHSFAAGHLTDLRRDLWGMALDMWRKHFWTGTGPGYFDYVYREFRGPLFQLQTHPGYAHNEYLNTLADWGMVGASLVALTCLLCLFDAGRSWRRLRLATSEGRRNRLAVLLGATCGIFALLLHSVTDFNMQIPANAIVFLTLMALVTECANSERWTLHVGWIPRLLASPFIICPLLYLSQQFFHRLPESRLLRQAEQLQADPNKRVPVLIKAFEVEPMNFQTAYEIGEIFRAQSWVGGPDYVPSGEKALEWFNKALALNPHYAPSAAHLAMTLQWLGKTADAAAAFDRANSLDPNGYYTQILQGWFRMQLGDYAGAKSWFERSLTLKGPFENTMAVRYLAEANRKLAEKASPAPP
jgi:O-antigen ligase